MKADYVELADDEEFFEDFINSLTDHQKMVFDSVLESEVYTEFDLKLQQKKLIHRNNELKAAVLEEQRKNGQFRKKRYGTKNKIESLKAENEKMILANEQLTNKINNLS